MTSPNSLFLCNFVSEPCVVVAVEPVGRPPELVDDVSLQEYGLPAIGASNPLPFRPGDDERQRLRNPLLLHPMGPVVSSTNPSSFSLASTKQAILLLLSSFLGVCK